MTAAACTSPLARAHQPAIAASPCVLWLGAVLAHSALEKRLSVDVDETSAAVFKQLDELRGSSTLSVTQLAAVEAIRKEVQSLCRKLVDTKGELAQSRRDTQVAEARVQSLQQQAFVLQQRIHMEQERSAAHQSQTSRMAASLEADSERCVGRACAWRGECAAASCVDLSRVPT